MASLKVDSVGESEGEFVGESLGELVGELVGPSVGPSVGLLVGEFTGFSHLLRYAISEYLPDFLKISKKLWVRTSFLAFSEHVGRFEFSTL